MLKYIGSEFYRISHKRIACIGFAVAVLLGLVPIDVTLIFAWLFPMAVGTLLFTTTYNDDLASKKLPTLIGFGLSKVTIFLAKVIVMAVLTAAVFALAAVARFALGSILSLPVVTATAADVFSAALQGYLCVMAYSTVAAIVVYGTQKAIPAVVTYIILSTTVITQVINAYAPVVSNYLIYNVSTNIVNGLGAGALEATDVIQYLVSLAVYAGLAIFAFRIKELEF